MQFFILWGIIAALTRPPPIRLSEISSITLELIDIWVSFLWTLYRWAFCKTKIFVQNQGMREILPQAYDWYSEDKILSITQSLGEKIVLQMAQMIVPAAHSDQGQAHSFYPNNKSGDLFLPTLASSPLCAKDANRLMKDHCQDMAPDRRRLQRICCAWNGGIEIVKRGVIVC